VRSALNKKASSISSNLLLATLPLHTRIAIYTSTTTNLLFKNNFNSAARPTDDYKMPMYNEIRIARTRRERPIEILDDVGENDHADAFARIEEPGY